MAYSRFGRDCRWYVYPMEGGDIECIGANARFTWLHTENLKHFQKKVMKKVRKPGRGYFNKDEADELFAIIGVHRKRMLSHRSKYAKEARSEIRTPEA